MSSFISHTCICMFKPHHIFKPITKSVLTQLLLGYTCHIDRAYTQCGEVLNIKVACLENYMYIIQLANWLFLQNKA